jgi:hypothetical protein
MNPGNGNTEMISKVTMIHDRPAFALSLLLASTAMLALHKYLSGYTVFLDFSDVESSKLHQKAPNIARMEVAEDLYDGTFQIDTKYWMQLCHPGRNETTYAYPCLLIAEMAQRDDSTLHQKLGVNQSLSFTRWFPASSEEQRQPGQTLLRDFSRQEAMALFDRLGITRIHFAGDSMTRLFLFIGISRGC